MKMHGVRNSELVPGSICSEELNELPLGVFPSQLEGLLMSHFYLSLIIIF